MKKLFLGALLVLAACSQSKQNQGEITSSDSTGIINGQPVSAEEDVAISSAQLFALVKMRDPKTGRQGVSVAGCTVSILSDNTVLTAAHCAAGQRMFLYFNKDVPSDLQAFFKGIQTNPLVREIEDGIIDDKWMKSRGEGLNQGDIAVLSFRGGLPEGYKPAQLVSSDFNTSSITDLILAGWGQTDGVKQTETSTLLKVGVKVVDMNYSETEMKVSRGACHGDSGGPAIATVNGREYVVGVTHAADLETDSEGQCVGNAIYTKVQPYLTMITEAQKTLSEEMAKNKATPSVAQH